MIQRTFHLLHGKKTGFLQMALGKVAAHLGKTNLTSYKKNIFLLTQK